MSFMSFESDLVAHLSSFRAAPFLFVGSGFSRRYADADDWAGLLQRFAAITGVPYERYSSKAGGRFPEIASLIAHDFHDAWWDGDEFLTSREAHPKPNDYSSPLKIEVANSLRDLPKKLPKSGHLHDELQLLKAATVEGIVTTNYDPVLESLFPGYRVFAGQDELLFHDPVGVGEIYKIHGSTTEPETLVLTSEDYDRFKDRNVYLAAKLLTIFVEHPIVFIGYSLEDDNIRDILANIARVLTRDNISKLQDRLIFIEWVDRAVVPNLASIPFPIDGVTIPMVGTKVNDFHGLFSALGQLKRRFPIKLLHELKQEIYELVQTSEPKGKLYVMDIDADVDISQVDIVVGVGLHDRLSAQGVTGLSRSDILRDIVEPHLPVGDQATMQKIVQEVLPRYLHGSTNTPVYRYLRAAGELNDDGSLVDPSRVPESVAKRAGLKVSALRAPSGYTRRALLQAKAATDLDDLVRSVTIDDALHAIPHMAAEKVDTGALRSYLSTAHDCLKDGNSLRVTAWAKGVCYLDFLENAIKAPSS